MSIYQALIRFGSENFSNESDKKFNTIMNQVMLYFIIVTAMMIVSVCLIYHFMLPEKTLPEYQGYLVYYIVPPFINLVVLAASYIIKNIYKMNRLLPGVAFFSGMLFLGSYSIMLGLGSSYYLYFYTITPLPFFALRKEDQKMVLVSLLIMLASDYFIEQNQALLPVPENINSLLHKVLLISTFVSIAFVCYYFWSESQKVEELLMKSQAELREKDRILQMELDIAAEIQKSILEQARPDESISFDVWFEPAGKVSGDYYDIFHTSRGIFILLADVSGHGIPAALVTIVAKSIFSRLVETETDPARILSLANRELCRQIQTQEFLTAFLLKIDNNNTITYANGGHMRPLFCRYENSTIEELDTDGILLGLVENPHMRFESKTMRAEKHDKLILYTDGITEQVNSKNQGFGHKRFKDIIAHQVFANSDYLFLKLRSELSSFAGTRQFNDDMTAIVIEFRNEPEQKQEAIFKREKVSI